MGKRMEDPSEKTGLERYLELDKKLGDVRSQYPSPEACPDVVENPLMDEMEYVWHRVMTQEERDEARRGPKYGWPDNWPSDWKPSWP